MNLLLRILLVLHLCGLAVMAGTTVVDYFTFRTFCNMTNAGNSQAHGLLPIMSRYGELVRIGAGLLLVTGVLMVTINSSCWDETWFKVKIALVILLVVNGMFVGNSLGTKFRAMAVNNLLSVYQGAKITAGLNCFYLVQLVLFLLIILVSVIRPWQNVIP